MKKLKGMLLALLSVFYIGAFAGCLMSENSSGSAEQTSGVACADCQETDDVLLRQEYNAELCESCYIERFCGVYEVSWANFYGKHSELGDKMSSGAVLTKDYINLIVRDDGYVEYAVAENGSMVFPWKIENGVMIADYERLSGKKVEDSPLVFTFTENSFHLKMVVEPEREETLCEWFFLRTDKEIPPAACGLCGTTKKVSFSRDSLDYRCKNCQGLMITSSSSSSESSEEYSSFDSSWNDESSWEEYSSVEESSSSVGEHEHDWIIRPGKEPTCTADGYGESKYCECGVATLAQYLPALDHDYVDHEGQEPTCTEIGWNAYQTCSRCDYTSCEEIPALDHDYVDHEGQEPTCTEIGWNAYQTCNRAGCTYTTYVQLPKKGHSYTMYESNMDATCIKDGTKTAICDNGCGETDTVTDKGSALGHDNVNHICSRCEEILYSEGLEYSLNDNKTEYMVTGIGACEDVDIWIPPMYNGLPVTTIGNHAFYKCYYRHILIPDNIVYMDSAAFLYGTTIIYCQAKSKPNGWAEDWNKSLGSVVWDCANNDVADDGYIYTIIDGVRYALQDGEAIVIKQSLKFTTISIPRNIVYNGTSYAVRKIGRGAFAGCDVLTSVKISDNIVAIEENAFHYCDSLAIYCEMASQPKGWDVDWNKLNDGDDYCPVVWNCNDNDIATDEYIYTMVDGIRYGIKDGVAVVVRQPNNITTANILDSIIYKEVEYSVTTIDYWAFGDCDRLVSAVIGEGVTTISQFAFANCDGATIYCKVASRPSGWHEDWNSNSSVVWDCENNEIAEDGYIYTFIDGLRYGIKDGEAIVAIQADNMTGATILKTITYKDVEYKVTAMVDGAFICCGNLRSVVINGVNSISKFAFYQCGSLMSVVIGDSVSLIDYNAFTDCENLKHIVIPHNVMDLSIDIFDYCIQLECIKFEGTVAEWKAMAQYINLNDVPATEVVCKDGSVAL